MRAIFVRHGQSTGNAGIPTAIGASRWVQWQLGVYEFSKLESRSFASAH